MTQYAFFFDQSRCTNCHACVVACRDWNDIEAGPVKWLRMLQWEKGVFPDVSMRTLFATCYHCENPLCADACPNGAIFKEDTYGAVLVDADLCTGERKCWMACPYGAPQYEDNAPGTPMSKCTMCYDKISVGDLPICVAGCPNRALDFGTLEEMEKRYGTSRTLEDLPDPALVEPAIIFKARSEKKQLITYNKERVLELMAVRGDTGFPDVYANPSDVTETTSGMVGYDRLVLKAASVEETLERSRNEEG